MNKEKLEKGLFKLKEQLYIELKALGLQAGDLGKKVSDHLMQSFHERGDTPKIPNDNLSGYVRRIESLTTLIASYEKLIKMQNGED